MAEETAKKRLAKNTVYLYALTFSSQLINLCTVPYQTRMLTAGTYGTVGFMVSLMNIFSLVLSFGFLYSATQGVAEHAKDKRYVSELYTAVLVIKLLLAALLFAGLGVAVALVPYLRENAVLVNLYFLAYLLAALLPDFLYRGYERMSTITVRTVCVRVLAAVMIFVFLRSDDDVLVLPVSQVVGNAAALAFCFAYDSRALGVRVCKVDATYVWRCARESAPFFVSRAASTVYQSMNAVILGALYPGQAVVGWYNASDKVLSVAKQASSPVADSIYPYMIKRKDYRLAKRLLVATAPLIVVGCAVLFAFADQFCLFLFGDQYAEAGDVLRCIIPAMAVIFPTYIICFPMLVPMGLSRQANTSTIIGMVVQLTLLGALALAGHLDVYTLCISASVSEVTVFAYRLAVLIRYRDRMRGDEVAVKMTNKEDVENVGD